MEFCEYEKMSNDFSKFEDNKEFYNHKWFVTEKIHGANFSFHTDGDTVRVARRRGLLDGNENFFNYQTGDFIKTYPDKIKCIFNSVAKLLAGKEIVQVSVYGELFGGKYIVDGKNLNTRFNAVQPQIQYCPDIRWCAFDISYRLKDNPEVHEYIDSDEAMKMFQEHDIFYLQPLFIGKMNEALNYNIDFDSTLPKQFGLPPLPKGSNKCEGIVVKPMKNLKAIYRGEETRVVVKIKSREFLEITTQKIKKENTGKPKQANLLQKMMAYSTEQRLTSAISKIGAPSKENNAKIIDEFMTDILTDVKEFDEDLYQEWSHSHEQQKIKDIIMKKANGLINKLNKGR